MSSLKNKTKFSDIHPQVFLSLACNRHDVLFMLGPSSGKNQVSTLVTDHIQKRRCQASFFSFEYNLLQKLLTEFYHCMDQASDATRIHSMYIEN